MDIDFIHDNSTLLVVVADYIPRKGDRVRFDTSPDHPEHYIVDEVLWVYEDMDSPDYPLSNYGWRHTKVIINLLRLG